MGSPLTTSLSSPTFLTTSVSFVFPIRPSALHAAISNLKINTLLSEPNIPVPQANWDIKLKS